jgi:ABC-type sugar transport system ATPase subunit
MTTSASESGAVRPDPRLRVEGLSKTFGPARVLFDASLTVAPGEIHALIGANGSGKSTLVKCITGVQAPDPGGVIEIDGTLIGGAYNTKEAVALGVRVVHQEAPLIDTLTIAELVGLFGHFPTRFGLLRGRALAAETRRILERLDVDLHPSRLGGSLSAAERAEFALALAVADVDEGARMIVLDEPTASLPAGDATRFLAAVRRAAESGAGVLLVTHRLSEVLSLAERVTVLRAGGICFSGDVADCSHDSLVDEIVGPTEGPRLIAEVASPAEGRFAPRLKRSAPRDAIPQNGSAGPVLEIEGLEGEILSGVDLSLHGGELLGVSGIVGSGASELGRLIAGIKRPRGGTIKVHGRALRNGFRPRDTIRAGIAYVPGDRLNEGGIAALPVLDNLTLPGLSEYGFDKRAERRDFDQVVDALDVRPPDPDRIFGTLSGGNQQKVIIGKWALMRPAVFVLDDPTAGVDPGAREDIYRMLRSLTAAGTAILVISSEPEQLARIADRVLTIRDGEVASEMVGDDLNERAISAATL